MPRNRRYKFTQKKHSKLGLVAFFFGIGGLLGFVLALVFSARAKGTMSPAAGVFGISFFLVSLAGMIMGIVASRDEDKFQVLPRAALIISIAGMLIWIGIYILGFYFWG
ncbi:MAG: hypothetical protein IJT05_06890 [Lachnospiraceae bacterium]|nr:hypothetical protein [Lachnospiraceae bacterium]MBQ7507041.1 hypothetical protein [Lachnospiraceae bacterium]